MGWRSKGDTWCWNDIDWDNNVEGDTVECPVFCVSREEVLQALNEMKTGRTPLTFRIIIGFDCF